MTHDDSVQIAATSPTQRHGRLHAATRGSVGRQSMRDVVVFRPSRNAGRAKRGVGVTTEAEIFRLAKH